MRVSGTSANCNLWFFKFNGNECSGPMTIEAVVFNSWPSGNPELLHHRSFEGYFAGKGYCGVMGRTVSRLSTR